MHLAIDWRGVGDDDDVCYCSFRLSLQLVLVLEVVKVEVLANTWWKIVFSSLTEGIIIDKSELLVTVELSLR